MMTFRELTKDLPAATVDLYQVNAWAGLWRFSSLGFIFLSLVAIVWLTDNDLIFWSITPIAGLFYVFWLICTHDTVHHTLTGWLWFERIMPRLVSYPMLWPYGVYAELHRLHHGWNGSDLRDPERVQWTQAEYEQAPPWLQWYVRHQWALDILGLGGIGLILKTVLNGLRFRAIVPQMRLQLWIDCIGIVIVQATLLTLTALHGELVRYLIFWLILERVIGAVGQIRDHLEHYALWGKASGHQLTQLYACRNLKTSPLVGWLMGGLNYHAVHHAFPGIPFNRLPEAFDRIQSVLHQHNLPSMQQGNGYLQETLYFFRHLSVISEATADNTTGRRLMISI